jgi:hypothetical protein
MKFLYASITVVGLMVLLPWSPHTGDPFNPETTHQAVAAIKLANLHRFALGAVLIVLSITGLVRESKINRMRTKVEQMLHRMAAPQCLWTVRES